MLDDLRGDDEVEGPAVEVLWSECLRIGHDQLPEPVSVAQAVEPVGVQITSPQIGRRARKSLMEQASCAVFRTNVRERVRASHMEDATSGRHPGEKGVLVIDVADRRKLHPAAWPPRASAASP